MAGFSKIAYTPSVQSAQEHYNGRHAGRVAEPVALSDGEREFIESRDSFYMATVNEEGWPYVQFRGGPTGFLRVLDERSIGWADFRGNRQYVSVGNLSRAPRAALILMDYPSRTRLKLFATVEVHDAETRPDLVERLAVKGYRGRIERAVVLRIEGFDWNCPQHITPRFTADEIAPFVEAKDREIEALRAELEKLKG